jgi:1-deoxy-D-xylulose-5-phosphate synthase
LKTPLLESINDISDLQALPLELLPELAAEIREVIIRTTSQVGGHVASSLGVVELTIALHYCLDSPRDKLIWDVGHQSYAHKLLTGRFRDFESLRTQGGLSGFPKRAESPHDVVETGHASTSISYALGLAIARDLAGEDYRVVAIIGDGALTGGMSYEALNQAGHLKNNLLIVLNDNGMAISQSVGALSTYLSQFSLYPNYRRMKEEVKSVLHVVPFVGNRL